jgi:hypothetical protein
MQLLLNPLKLSGHYIHQLLYHVCMCKGWARNPALAPRPSMIYCALLLYHTKILRYVRWMNSVVEFYVRMVSWRPIKVAARSKAWTVFAPTHNVVMGSNSTRGMAVWVRLFCVCVFLPVGSGLAMGWSSVRGVLPTVYRITELESGHGPKEGCRVIDDWMNAFLKTWHNSRQVFS